MSGLNLNLVLERGDLLQLEPISHKGTLKLFPLGKKNKQKLVIGDDSGHVYCYEFKKGEPQVVFQSKPFEGPITCVALGGNPVKRDMVFVSHSQSIRGMNKKGKETFKLISSLTETIENIVVEDTRIWTGCECIYSLYDNGKETALYASKDVINDLLACRLTRANDFDAVLACQDSCIRVVHGSQLFVEIPTANAATALAMVEGESTTSSAKANHLIYGMSNGSIGLASVTSTGEFTLGWVVDDAPKRSPVTCMKVFDINKDGVPEIIVGRDDGRIEVFRCPEGVRSSPAKIFSRDIGESIRSVECGAASSADHNEIVLASYSGKVISFTTEQVHGRAYDDNYGRSVQTVNNENRIKHLRKELDELRKKAEKEREKVKRISSTGHANNAVLKPAAHDFSVIESFKLDENLAAYVLSVELQTPIDLIIIRSPVELNLVETDSTSAVLSVTPAHLQPSYPGEEAAGKFVAVFRCQSQQEKRIVLTLRTNEGEHGDMTVTIVAASSPKAAKIVKYNLKPLSLNCKVRQIDAVDFRRPRNSVRYTGNMAISTIHEWVRSIFPDVPPRLDETATQQTHYFRNTFTGAFSVCEFRQNELILESESASTVAIAKENVTRLANYRRVQLEEHMSVNDLSIASFLELIRSKLDHQLSLARKMQLVDAVQEIAMAEPDLDWLSQEHKDILRDQETIRREFKGRDRSLDYLCGIVTDLFVDWHKLQGLPDPRQLLPQMVQTVMAGDFDGTVALFMAASPKGPGGVGHSGNSRWK